MKTKNIYSKRGILNKLNIGIYVLFNLLMTTWLFGFLLKVGEISSECTGEYADACMAGSGLGGMIGLSFLLGVWLVFGLIGLLIIYMSRPKVIGTESE